MMRSSPGIYVAWRELLLPLGRGREVPRVLLSCSWSWSMQPGGVGGEIGTGVEQTESQKELICLELQNQNMFLEEYQSSFPPSRSEGSK